MLVLQVFVSLNLPLFSSSRVVTIYAVHKIPFEFIAYLLYTAVLLSACTICMTEYMLVLF